MQRNGTTTPEGSAFGSKWRDRFGPGLLVTAAFIGPGTVATASVIGASYGFALTWALAFSVVATIILQEMSARLGLVTGAGLGESLRSTFSGRIARPIVVVLVIAAIGIGNAAFQTGNIMGGAVGLELLTPVSHKWWALVVGLAAALILAFGGYRRIELLLVGLVGVMSVVFVLTAIMTRPDIRVVLDGIFKPRLPSGSLTTVLALIGTTVVPYNLFLHASAVAEKWGGAGSARQYIRHARIDTIVSVSIGGIITLAIMSTAAMLPAGGKGITNAAAMAEQLDDSWFNVSTFKEPYRVEGKKTMGLEIAEALGWEFPDVVIYPTGGGTGLIGIWKAFQELRSLGWVRQKMPRMVAVQAEGCAPVVEAFLSGSATTKPWPKPHTRALGLNVPAPLGGEWMLNVLRESNGTALAIPEDHIAPARERMQLLAGMPIGAEVAVAWRGLELLIEQNWIAPEDRVALVVTGDDRRYS